MADTSTQTATDITSPKGGSFGGQFAPPAGLDPNTLAILMNSRWTTAAGGATAATNLTYAFPGAKTDYTSVATYPQLAEVAISSPLSAEQRQAALIAMAQVASYTKLTFTQAASGSAADAALRFSAYTSSGSEANFPANNGPYSPNDARSAGDNWEGGNAVFTAGDPLYGTDALATIAHELAHSLGLKHGHDDSFNGKLAAARNDNEFSIMTYASYLGSNTAAPTEAINGSTPSTWMMYDIAALQQLYGANYGNVGASFTYTWDAAGQQFINGVAAANTGVTKTQKILETVWTGGAKATFNISNYNDNGQMDLRPGQWLTFSRAQISDLNSTAAANTPQYQAQGNVYNALTFNGDTRSEISDLVVGNGNVSIIGNDLYNTVTLGNGNDMVTLGAAGGKVLLGTGADIVVGGAGIDTVVFNVASTAAGITRNANGSVSIQVAGNGVDTLTNVEFAQFTDKTVALDPTTGVRRFFDTKSKDHFYTQSATEAANIRATLPTYQDEGTPWSTPAKSGDTQDLFRFFDTKSGSHFLTNSAAERDQVMATLPTYQFEGVAFQVFTTATANTLTLQRFFNASLNIHTYAASAAETASIRTGGAGPGWVDEGAGFIVGAPV